MTVPPSARCAVHPVRRAVDSCPVCERPRCAADASGRGCASCGGEQSSTAGSSSSPPPREQLVRGALAAQLTAVLGGVVAAQYVGAELFAYLTPFVVGVLTGAAAQAAAGAPRTGAPAMRLRAVAALYAVLGVGLGFALEGSEGALEPGSVLPYLAAVVGVVLWTLPPRVR